MLVLSVVRMSLSLHLLSDLLLQSRLLSDLVVLMEVQNGILVLLYHDEALQLSQAERASFPSLISKAQGLCQGGS